jgi:hypothetical protein
MLALTWHCATSVEALGDNFDRSQGFWLRDGGSAHKCHSVDWTGCGLRPHSRWSGNEVGSAITPLGAIDVSKLAIITLIIREHGFQVSAVWNF